MKQHGRKIDRERPLPEASGLVERGRLHGRRPALVRPPDRLGPRRHFPLMPEQPVQPIEIVREPGFGVFLRVIQDSDRPRIARLANRREPVQVAVPFANRQNLEPLRLAVGQHPIQIEAIEMRFHQRQQFREPIEMGMAMMQVVDNPDVVEPQFLDDRHLVFRLSKPAPMVVERDAAALVLRGQGDGTNPLRLRLDPRRKLFRSLRRRATPRDPQLRADAMPLERRQNQPGFVIERSGKPPGRELNPMSLQRLQFGIEQGDVVRTVVVCQPANPQPIERPGPFFRCAVAVIERHDAPGDEIFAAKHRVCRLGLVRRIRGNRPWGDRSRDTHQPNQQPKTRAHVDILGEF